MNRSVNNGSLGLLNCRTVIVAFLLLEMYFKNEHLSDLHKVQKFLLGVIVCIVNQLKSRFPNLICVHVCERGISVDNSWISVSSLQ